MLKNKFFVEKEIQTLPVIIRDIDEEDDSDKEKKKKKKKDKKDKKKKKKKNKSKSPNFSENSFMSEKAEEMNNDFIVHQSYDFHQSRNTWEDN